MRLLLFLGLATVVVALFDAIIWEAEGFYKAYLMERMLYPEEDHKWVICPECTSGRTTDEFRAELRALGLPENTANIAEFISTIGTQQLSHFGRPNGGILEARWKTMNYQMMDLLVEMRRLRQELNVYTFLFSGQRLLKSDLLPASVIASGEISLPTMQDLVTKRVEQCRQAAKGAVSVAIERLVRERIDALKVENMYRNSDQARFKRAWYASELGIGPPPKRFDVITTPEHVVFPDGTVPQADPLNTRPGIETWDAIDQDATLAQGGHSPVAVARRKADAQKASAYGKSSKSSPVAQDHQAVIEKNLEGIKWHEKAPGDYFTCGKKGGKRSFLPANYWDL